MNKIVYIASPYTKGDQAQNVRTSLMMAEKIREFGYLPYCPLLSHFWHFLFPHDYEYWMKQGLEWVERSDILVRLPGESKGADDEVFKALSLGIPVFYSFNEFKLWHYRQAESFNTYQKVRVKDGVMDCQFPDVDLSGWTGDIFYMDGNFVVVLYDDDTLDNKMPQWMKDESDKRGLSYCEYAFNENEIERMPDDTE